MSVVPNDDGKLVIPRVSDKRLYERRDKRIITTSGNRRFLIYSPIEPDDYSGLMMRRDQEFMKRLVSKMPSLGDMQNKINAKIIPLNYIRKHK